MILRTRKVVRAAVRVADRAARGVAVAAPLAGRADDAARIFWRNAPVCSDGGSRLVGQARSQVDGAHTAGDVEGWGEESRTDRSQM